MFNLFNNFNNDVRDAFNCNRNVPEYFSCNLVSNNHNSCEKPMLLTCVNSCCDAKCCVPGPAGPAGPMGPMGPMGTRGKQGEQGEQGIQGEKGDKGDKGEQGIQGIQGEQGIPGNDGSMADTTCCFCVSQMKNVISQLIKKYPTQQARVTMESGKQQSGYLSSIFPNYDDGGMVSLKNASGNLIGAASLCHIAAIDFSGIAYSDTIVYLDAPDPLPEGCDTDCEEAIRFGLPIGTKVNVTTGDKSLGNGTVTKNEFGMLVITNESGQNPAFVSICKIENISAFVEP